MADTISNLGLGWLRVRSAELIQAGNGHRHEFPALSVALLINEIDRLRAELKENDGRQCSQTSESKASDVT
jgi:hypothetical protein